MEAGENRWYDMTQFEAGSLSTGAGLFGRLDLGIAWLRFIALIMWRLQGLGARFHLTKLHCRHALRVTLLLELVRRLVEDGWPELIEIFSQLFSCLYPYYSECECDFGERERMARIIMAGRNEPNHAIA